MALSAVSCGRRVGFRSAYPAREIAGGQWSTPTPELFLASLATRAPAIREMAVEGGGRVSLPEGGGFVSLNAIYQEPDRLRLRGSRLDITLFDLVVDGESASLYDRDAGARFDGTVGELALLSGPVAAMPPRELVAALAVLPLLRRLAEGPEPFVVSDRGGYLLAASPVPGVAGGNGIWLIRKEDGLVREFLLRGADGREELRVQYKSWGRFGPGQQPMPTRLKVIAPGAEATLDLDISSYRLDPGLQPRQFEPQRARRVVPMAALLDGSWRP
jgi:hypothetical protein